MIDPARSMIIFHMSVASGNRLRASSEASRFEQGRDAHEAETLGNDWYEHLD